MEVDDVETLVVEDRSDPVAVEDGATELLDREAGEQPLHAARALEPMYGYARRLRGVGGLAVRREQPERVYVVDHVDIVAAARQRVAEPADKDRVAAEVVRRIERGDHGDLQGADPGQVPRCQFAKGAHHPRYTTRRLVLMGGGPDGTYPTGSPGGTVPA